MMDGASRLYPCFQLHKHIPHEINIASFSFSSQTWRSSSRSHRRRHRRRCALSPSRVSLVCIPPTFLYYRCGSAGKFRAMPVTPMLCEVTRYRSSGSGTAWGRPRHVTREEKCCRCPEYPRRNTSLRSSPWEQAFLFSFPRTWRWLDLGLEFMCCVVCVVLYCVVLCFFVLCYLLEGWSEGLCEMVRERQLGTYISIYNM